MLDEIVRHRREAVARLKAVIPLQELRRRAHAAPPPRSLSAGLQAKSGVAVIAETKKASPSRGVLCPNYDPARMARTYEENGAAAISVLTENRYFGGRAAHLRQVRQTVSVPVLRKDFIIDPYQLYESRALGADAVLLIAALFDGPGLSEMVDTCLSLGMEPLVEVHTGAEVTRALTTRASLIGINNRDLTTFHCRLETTLELAVMVPPGHLVVSESGIRRWGDVVRVAAAGARAVLVGEALVAASDPGAALRALTRSPTGECRGSL